MSKKIRVVLKDGDQYAVVLWIKLTNKFVMVSHTLLESHYQQFYPSGTNFHRHEIYFKNGDYHSSFKFYDQHSKLYIDRKIYADTIVIMSSPTADFAIKCIDKIPRDNNNQDSTFIDYEMKPWDQNDAGHVFGTLAYRFSFNGLRHYHHFNIDDFDALNDLLIDTRKHKDEIMNISAMFYKTGHSYLGDLSNINTPKSPIAKRISIGNLNACAYVIFAFQKRTLSEKIRYKKLRIKNWFSTILLHS